MKLTLWSIAIASSLSRAALAQTGHREPFSQLTLRGGVTRFSADSRLSRYYSPETGFLIEVSTPFEFGELAVTGERATFTSVGAVHPDFHGTLGMLAWRYPQHLFGPISAAVGAHAGAMQFSFQDTEINAGLRKERELLLGVNGSLEARIVPGFSAFVMGEYSHVRLRVPVHLARLSVGIGYTVPTPVWLRDFLR